MVRRAPPRLTASDGRRFAFTVGLAFLVLGGLVALRGTRGLAFASAALGGALVAAGVLVPRHLGGVQAFWMKLARLISRVTTPVFMSIVFLLVMTPVGILRRLVARNSLVHEEKDGSFWKSTDANRVRSMERQF